MKLSDPATRDLVIACTVAALASTLSMSGLPRMAVRSVPEAVPAGPIVLGVARTPALVPLVETILTEPTCTLGPPPAYMEPRRDVRLPVRGLQPVPMPTVGLAPDDQPAGNRQRR